MIVSGLQVEWYWFDQFELGSVYGKRLFLQLAGALFAHVFVGCCGVDVVVGVVYLIFGGYGVVIGVFVVFGEFIVEFFDFLIVCRCRCFSFLR